ncbi:MAG: hypothetical protein ACOC2H_04795 [Spirochaetota bacterium]
MKRRCIIALLVAVCTACTMMPLKENDYYTRNQKEMIELTADAVGVGFGYESRLDINYFFYKQGNAPTVEGITSGDVMDERGRPKITIDNEERTALVFAYSKAVSSFSDTDQYDFYFRIYRLHSMIEYLKGYYERHKMWRLYNIIRLDLYPATKYYMEITESYFRTQKPALYSRILTEKDEVQKDAIMYIQKKYTIVDEYQ